MLTGCTSGGDKSRPAGAGPEPGRSRLRRGQGRNALLTMLGHARNGLPAIRVTGRAHGARPTGRGRVKRKIRVRRLTVRVRGPGVRSPPLMEASGGPGQQRQVSGAWARLSGGDVTVSVERRLSAGCQARGPARGEGT